MRTKPTKSEVMAYELWLRNQKVQDSVQGESLPPRPIEDEPLSFRAPKPPPVPPSLEEVKQQSVEQFPPAYVPPTTGMPEPEWLRTTGEVMDAIVGAPVKFALALPSAVVSSVNNAWNLYAHVAAGGKFVDPETKRELTYIQAMDPKEASETLRTAIGVANLDMATIPFGGGAKGALGAGSKSTDVLIKAAEKFYSPLERALETGQVGKLSIPDNPKASGMLSTFKYATDKNLINVEELNYTGLLQKLKDLGDARISRDEMLKLVKSKSLKETGQPSVLTNEPTPTPQMLKEGEAYARLQEKADELDQKISQLEHTENTYTGGQTEYDIALRRLVRMRNAVEEGMQRISMRNDAKYEGTVSKYGPENYANFNLPGHLPGTYEERLFHFTPEGGLRYVEPHDWPGNVAENAFMFTRGHDRKLPNGELAKHLDETQSSLHQKAMEEGYTDVRMLERASAIQDELIKNEKERVAFVQSKDWTYSGTTQEMKDKLNSFMERDTNLRNELLDIKQNRSNIPPAPFKDLKWAKLGLKEWVDTAVREGKDAVTWSTGRIVADRYNKLVKSFNWNKDLKTGKYTLHFETPNGRTFDQGYVNLKQMQDNAGKNVARIVEEQEKLAVEFRDKRDIASALDVVKRNDGRYEIIDKVEQENLGIFKTASDANDERNAIIRDYQHPRTIVGDGATGDFLVGGKFFEKVYDEYMVREAEREYGVRPVKIKTEIEPQLEDVLKTGVGPSPAKTIEVWYLPLSPELKQSITIKGQRIAQGNLTTAQALRQLSQHFEKATKPDESIDHDSRPPFESGKASWYGPGFHGRKMSNKQKFDQDKISVAHRKLPFGTKVRVTDTDTGKSIVAEVTDRGPYIDGRIVDLSKGAAKKLGTLKKGVANVRVEIVEKAKEKPPHIVVK